MPSRLALLGLVALAPACLAKPPRGAITWSLAPHGAVLNLPPGYVLRGLPSATREPDRLTIDLPKAGAIVALPGGAGTAIRALQGGQDRATMVLAPGSATRIRRRGRRIDIDVTGAPAPVTANPSLAAPASIAAKPALPVSAPRTAQTAPASATPDRTTPAIPPPDDHAQPAQGQPAQGQPAQGSRHRGSRHRGRMAALRCWPCACRGLVMRFCYRST